MLGFLNILKHFVFHGNCAKLPLTHQAELQLKLEEKGWASGPQVERGFLGAGNSDRTGNRSRTRTFKIKGRNGVREDKFEPQHTTFFTYVAKFSYQMFNLFQDFPNNPSLT